MVLFLNQIDKNTRLIVSLNGCKSEINDLKKTNKNNDKMLNETLSQNKGLKSMMKIRDSLLAERNYFTHSQVSTYSMISNIRYLINCGELGRAKAEYEKLESVMMFFKGDKELNNEAKTLSLKIEKDYIDWSYKMNKKKMRSFSGIKETPNIIFSGIRLKYSGYSKNVYDRRWIKFTYTENAFGYEKACPVMLAYRPVGENLVKVTELSVSSYSDSREMKGYFDVDKNLRKYPVFLLVSKVFSRREENSGFGLGFKSDTIYYPDIETACPDTIHVSDIERDFFVVKILNREAL